MAHDVKATIRRSKTTAKAPADTTAKTAAISTPKPAQKPRTTRTRQGEGVQITAADRLRHIETAAYYLAEQRGFNNGNPADDWYAAERQIDHLLLAGQLSA